MPIAISPYFWPAGLPINDLVGTFEDVYRQLGYEVCADGSVEEGFEKIVLYATQGRCLHASRLLSSGNWASKLGEDIDIEHERADSLNSVKYGDASVFMRRPAQPSTEAVSDLPNVAEVETLITEELHRSNALWLWDIVWSLHKDFRDASLSEKIDLARSAIRKLQARGLVQLWRAELLVGPVEKLDMTALADLDMDDQPWYDPTRAQTVVLVYSVTP
jgi:hypothetical protein